MSHHTGPHTREINLPGGVTQETTEYCRECSPPVNQCAKDHHRIQYYGAVCPWCQERTLARLSKATTTEAVAGQPVLPEK